MQENTSQKLSSDSASLPGAAFHLPQRTDVFFNFWMTEVIFVGPLIPQFWTLGNVCPGFPSQGGFSCMLSCLCDRQTYL